MNGSAFFSAMYSLNSRKTVCIPVQSPSQVIFSPSAVNQDSTIPFHTGNTVQDQPAANEKNGCFIVYEAPGKDTIQ
jgi:DsbC/DsbD-like thiol-disulfide interchange protein